MHLHEALAQRVGTWREQGYPCENYPAIAEMLEWAAQPEGAGFRLRVPQLRALETYWYLRLIESTPGIPELYRRLFPRVRDLLSALGVPDEAFGEADFDLENLWRRIGADDDFVRRYRFEALRETLTLGYPSYILALAMGAGKTALMGAIVATEFAMADEYRDDHFVENALVFAPGTTILESLRELAEVPYDRILPPRLYKSFAASVKITFTRDGDPDIPVIEHSSFNLVVTNTEKIRIQKESIRKKDLGTQLAFPSQEEEARTEVANRRLQKIASLPHLAVFSDEAHHTYGRALDTELKRVRQTVDYLAANTRVVCVVNTTGTPYFQRQLLRDVVVWYGLSEGIRDGILKEVAGNIQAYNYSPALADDFVREVVQDFFQAYGDVTLPNGAPAKLAIYFPQTDDLSELRPVVEQTLTTLGYPHTLVLRNTNESTQAEIDAFNRLNDPGAPHRVILLVNKGTEGWDCPSLFACALARKLRSSNNFVLQAACRCLRQVPGNRQHARIYLSMENRGVLDRQLQETYGETLADLDHTGSQSATATITLQKVDLPPLVIRQVVRTVVRQERADAPLQLARPKGDTGDHLERVTYDVGEQVSTQSVLQAIDEVEIETTPDTISVYAAASELSAVYRVDLWTVYDELRRLFPAGEISLAYLGALAQQIEEQRRDYVIQEETVEKALALVKPEGFTRVETEGSVAYTAEITYPVDRQHLLLSLERLQPNPHALGFHYTPYNFDSGAEQNFFEQLLAHMNTHPDDVEDIYFTGALTDPRKTDFYVEYRGEDGRPHRYTPDFILRRKDGKCLIVEIKDARFQAATREDLRRDAQGQAAITVEGRKAVALKRWEKLNPDRLKYEMVFATGEALGIDQLRPAREFVDGEQT